MEASCEAMAAEVGAAEEAGAGAGAESESESPESEGDAAPDRVVRDPSSNPKPNSSASPNPSSYSSPNPNHHHHQACPERAVRDMIIKRDYGE